MTFLEASRSHTQRATGSQRPAIRVRATRQQAEAGDGPPLAQAQPAEVSATLKQQPHVPAKIGEHEAVRPPVAQALERLCDASEDTGDRGERIHHEAEAHCREDDREPPRVCKRTEAHKLLLSGDHEENRQDE